MPMFQTSGEVFRPYVTANRVGHCIGRQKQECITVGCVPTAAVAATR